MAAQVSTSPTVRRTAPLSRLEATARARARATLVQGLVIVCLAAVGSYLQAAYLRPYLAIRRLCATADSSLEEPR